MTSESTNTPATPELSQLTMGQRFRNFLVVMVAIALSIVLFLSSRLNTEQPSLSNLAANATPLEAALANQKPTLIEFYANWCTSCQSMADEMQSLKGQFADDVNFVMLNVDNNKWLPEILKFDVDGIPHFVFLNAENEALASTIGQQPQQILADNLSALVASNALTRPQEVGDVSIIQPRLQGSQADPRSHGGLPANAS